MEKNNWNFWIDKGGTFTDVIALSPNNDLFLEKVLSQSQNKNDDPVSTGIKKILTNNSADLKNIGNITVGTTKATNTLLERTGEKILQKNEMELVSSLRRSYAASRNLENGTILSLSDLILVRPGIGIKQGQEERIIGKTLKRCISFAELVKTKDLID